ncbi:MAG: hypothetical protein A2X23_05745 [Chloroflexi bacterium GWC2_73_18]|nr:MAG: hypothetical protein A2X23_05745 [Chloroflexi bacterium GWC2_73_18]
MRDLVPIGRFSRVSRLTIAALRHYDELGLLRPAHVDPDSGYRYYSLAQAGDAERIRLLRSLEMPLDEIRALLDEREAALRRRLLERHRGRLEERLAGSQASLAFLQRLLDEEVGPMDYEIKIRETPPQPMLSVRRHTSLPELGPLMGRTYGELFGYLGRNGIRPAGPPFAIYHDPDFREEDIDVEMGVPLAEPVAGEGELRGGELPAGPAAYTLHGGPYEEIGPAYQALVGWMQVHGHEGAGPPREVYLVGPGQAPDPSGYRTEIVWPIR